MRIAWLTDIHLDHLAPNAIDGLSAKVAEASVDAVVLTGDISVAPRLGEHLERLIADFAGPVWLVLGNHDYWGSSVAEVREALRAMRGAEPRLRWLQHEGPVLLDHERALVGVDGWADARLGDPLGSPVRLRDYDRVQDLVHADRGAALDAARAIADGDAATLRTLLDDALRLRSHVYVATHIPPFAEAALFRGMMTTAHFLPWVTCKAVGDALLDAAERHPDRRITVLCGHMHHRAHVWMRPNLEVRTGAAEYGAPAIEDVIEL
jgi:predicted phosphohydrolase